MKNKPQSISLPANNNPTDMLATISQEGEVPESRLTDAYSAMSITRRLINADSKRDFKAACLNGLVDGLPPYKASKLKEMGRSDATNVNWGTGRAFLESGAGALFDLVTEAPGMFDVCTYYGTEEQRAQWSRDMSYIADCVFKKCKRWDYERQVSQWNTTLHGTGPLLFEDSYTVCPRAFKALDLKVPEMTYSETDYWDMCVILASYYPPQLYKFIRNLKPGNNGDLTQGWDVNYTREIISHAMGIHSGNQRVYSWEWYQQQLKNNALMYYDDTLICRLAHVAWKEFDGSVSYGIVPQDEAMGVDIKWLYRKENRYPNFTQCVHPMYWDRGNGGYHHSVTGLGTKMFSPMDAENRLICNLFDKAVAPKILLSPTTTETQQKFSLAEQIGDFAVLPRGMTPNQTGIAGLINDGMEMLQETRSISASNLSQYRQPVQQKSGNPVTAYEKAYNASQEAALNKTQYVRYYEQLDCLYAEKFRRLALAGNPDPMAKEFKERCDEMGIPKEAYKPENIEYVRAVRVVGQGNAFMRRQSLSTLWVGLAPSLNEEGRENLKDDIIAAEAGQQAVKRYNPKRTPTTLPTDQEAEATQWVGDMKVGVKPKITATQNPLIYATVWLGAAGEAVQAAQSGAPLGPIIGFLDIVGPAIGAQIQRMAQDETRKEIVQKLEQQWQELTTITDQLKVAAKKQAQQAQEQMARTQQALTDEQIKQMEFQASQARSDAKIRQQLDTKGEKADQDLRIKAEKHMQDMAIAGRSATQDLILADAKSATDIRLKAQETRNKNRDNGE